MFFSSGNHGRNDMVLRFFSNITVWMLRLDFTSLAKANTVSSVLRAKMYTNVSLVTKASSERYPPYAW